MQLDRNQDTNHGLGKYRHKIPSTHEERMETERMHRLMDGETEVKRKCISPAKAAKNNAVLAGNALEMEAGLKHYELLLGEGWRTFCGAPADASNLRGTLVQTRDIGCPECRRKHAAGMRRVYKLFESYRGEE